MAIDRQQAFSGTKEAAPALRLDAARLETYLSAQVTGFAGPLAVKQFKGGQSNPTYLVTAGDRRYVLRRKPPGKLLPSAHAVDREYRVITALAQTGVPVPRTFGLCEDDAVIGTAFYLMAYVPGRVLWDPRLPGMAVAERRATHDEINRVIAALHCVDPDSVGLADFGKTGEYIARQVGRWSKQYLASETEKIEAQNRTLTPPISTAAFPKPSSLAASETTIRALRGFPAFFCSAIQPSMRSSSTLSGKAPAPRTSRGSCEAR